MADLSGHVVVVTAVDVVNSLVTYTLDGGSPLSVVIPQDADTSSPGIQALAASAAGSVLDAQAAAAAIPDYSDIIGQPVSDQILTQASTSPPLTSPPIKQGGL